MGGRPQPSSFLLRGRSQFPDSLVEVLTWLWAAVWGREAGQMSRSPGEEAAPWEGGQGFWPGKTTSSPFDLALSAWMWAKAPVPVCVTDRAAASLIRSHLLLENKAHLHCTGTQVKAGMCKAWSQC